MRYILCKERGGSQLSSCTLCPPLPKRGHLTGSPGSGGGWTPVYRGQGGDVGSVLRVCNTKSYKVISKISTLVLQCHRNTY